MCGLKVTPGVYHECKKSISFVPSTSQTYWCAWCQSHATPIAGNGTTTCSNCGHNLHGAIANPGFTVMHYPYSNNHNNWF
jgi:ribosomal protein L37AE/L43A